MNHPAPNPLSPEEQLFFAARDGDVENTSRLIAAGVIVNALVTEPDHRQIAPGTPNITFRFHKKTPLIGASEQGRLEIVEILIAAGADVDRGDEYIVKDETQDRTALNYAAAKGHLDVVRALIRAKANIELADNTGATPLDRASSTAPAEVVAELIKAGANPNRGRPLHSAVMVKDAAKVSLLIAAGANIEKEDKFQTTPLMRAYANLDMLRLLLKAGANVNTQVSDGDTALIRACYGDKHDLNVVKELVVAGADVNLTNKKGRTALDSALRYRNTRKATIEYLESVGAKRGEDLNG